MNNQDIRWQQRFASYKKALLQLKSAVELSKQRALTQLEKKGVVQAFEFTHELAWNMLKDFPGSGQSTYQRLKRCDTRSVQG